MVTPEDIMPIPSCSGLHLKSKRTQKRGKTVVLTESPYRNELEKSINEKNEKEMQKKERATVNLGKRFAGNGLTEKSSCKFTVTAKQKKGN